MPQSYHVLLQQTQSADAEVCLLANMLHGHVVCPLAGTFVPSTKTSITAWLMSRASQRESALITSTASPGHPLMCSGMPLQVIVSRMRYISSQLAEGPAIRFVGLCTSLANAKDLGEWIGASSHGLYNFPPGESRLHFALMSWEKHAAGYYSGVLVTDLAGFIWWCVYCLLACLVSWSVECLVGGRQQSTHPALSLFSNWLSGMLCWHGWHAHSPVAVQLPNHSHSYAAPSLLAYDSLLARYESSLCLTQILVY